jgi:chromosome segregation ATPase
LEAQRLTAENLEAAHHDLAVMHAKLAEARQGALQAAGQRAKAEAHAVTAHEAHEQALAAQAAAAAADFESLRQELHRTEAAKAAVEHDLAATLARLQEKEEVEKVLTETQAQLRKAKAAGEAAAQRVASKQAEIATLKRQLSESASGREILQLRERNEKAQAELERAERSLRHSEEEQDRQAAEGVRLKASLEALRLRCMEAEQQSAGGEVGNAEILRGIIDRQKAELEEMHAALVRLRRAKVGLHVIYAIVAALSIGAVLAVAQVLNRLMTGGHFPSLL